MAGLEPDRAVPMALAEALHDDAEFEKKGYHPSDDSSHSRELDGVHDGLEFPTQEEQQTLRRVADAIPWTSYSELYLFVRPLPFPDFLTPAFFHSLYSVLRD
jgi:proton-dependent oligopeptide transporter, POT family